MGLHVTLLLLSVCLSLCLAAQRSRVHCSADLGCAVSHDYKLREAGISSLGSGSVLWKKTQPIDIYDTVAFTNKGYNAISSYGSNYASHDTLEVDDAASGKVKWTTTNGTDFDIAVDKRGESNLFGVMDRIPCCPVPTTTMFSNALQFSVDSAKPVRNATLFKSVITSGFSGVAQSSDGSVFAYGYDYLPHFPLTDEYYARVVVVKSGAIIKTLTFANASTIDDVELSYDGRYLTMFVIESAGENPYVYDLMKNAFVLNGSKADWVSAVGFCVSPSAKYIVAGFQAIDAWSRDDSTGAYTQIVANGALPIEDVFFAVCAVSDDGALGMAFFNSEYSQTYAAVVTLGSSLETVWTWSSDVENSTDQDYPVAAAMDPYSNLFAFCSWGTGVGMTPTARVFAVKRATPQEIYNVTTPGSMFGIDLAASPESKDSYLMITAGKHVHANVMGDGGDLVVSLIKYDED